MQGYVRKKKKKATARSLGTQDTSYSWHLAAHIIHRSGSSTLTSVLRDGNRISVGFRFVWVARDRNLVQLCREGEIYWIFQTTKRTKAAEPEHCDIKSLTPASTEISADTVFLN